MKLYKYSKVITVVPAETPKSAIERYDMATECHEELCEQDFEVVIDHVDFIKIFRLARMLDSIEQYDCKDIEVIVHAYVKRLGYELTVQELHDGILNWVERLSDLDDEEVEEWIN